MITTEGKNHIRRYLAGYVPAIAQSVAFGIGTRAEAAGDIALQMETVKASINLTTYDFVNNKLVYKASIPEEYVGKIYEIGVYSLEFDPAAADFSSRTLTTFDSAAEDWVVVGSGAAATYTASRNLTSSDATTTRVGTDSVLLTPAASANTTVSLPNIALDLSGYSSSDTLNFAFNVGNAFTSQIRFRFLTNSASYYDFSLGAQTAGYKITEVAKSSAVVTGTPSWDNITEIQVYVSSTAGGASNIELDAIRVEDKDSASLDYILVARKVLATPVVKLLGQAQDIEFTLDVAV